MPGKRFLNSNTFAMPDVNVTMYIVYESDSSTVEYAF